MSQLDRVLAEALKQPCEAIVISTMRPVHVLAQGGLRPLSNRPLTTQEILNLLAEVTPAPLRAGLSRDCELSFTYRAAGLPAVEIKLSRKADFVFARLEPPATVPPPVPTSQAALFEGLDFDLEPSLPEPVAPARSRPPAARASLELGTARDLEFDVGDGADFQLDTEPSPACSAEPVVVEISPPPAPRAPAPAPAAAAAPVPPAPAPVAAAAAPTTGLAMPTVASRALPQLLKALVSHGGSDLHVAAGSPPRMRLRGDLEAVGEACLTPADTQAMFESILSADQRQRFQAEMALDFSLDLPGVGRFRANAYRQRKGLDLVFRAIARTIPTMAELGLPEAAAKLTEFPNGLILVTGPAGCGKSTTQAAIIDRINQTWHDHIITVEDPIEFVHPTKGCLINQREVGTHVRTFAEALRSALREDPDVILVGELRDLETIQLAITAAETGHLVLGTLHTIDAARTIARLIDVFPGEQKLQMRSMVSESLRGIISQRLLPTADGTGRVAAFELLLGDRSVANLIREGKTFQIPNVLRMGKGRGMCSMDDSLIQLALAKKITVPVARESMERPDELDKLLAAAQAPAPPRGRRSPGATRRAGG